ncbi:hypothetical protein N7507_006885 [Penicillium longicatenatum]|nr:hypothetical protein N7507_006885 [Penicillium longicatenatum]
MISTNSLDSTLKGKFLFACPIAHPVAPNLHASLFKKFSLPWTFPLFETKDASEFLPVLKQQDILDVR